MGWACSCITTSNPESSLTLFIITDYAALSTATPVRTKCRSVTRNRHPKSDDRVCPICSRQCRPYHSHSGGTWYVSWHGDDCRRHPGTRSNRPIPRVHVTSLDVAIVGRVQIRYHREECRGMATATYQKFVNFKAQNHSDNLRIVEDIHIVWVIQTCLVRNDAVRVGDHPGKASVMFLPIIDLLLIPVTPYAYTRPWHLLLSIHDGMMSPQSPPSISPSGGRLS